MGCHDNMEISVPCSSVSQSMMNTTGLWWDHEAMSEVSSSPAHIYNRFGVLDSHWTLGGPMCGCPGALILPDMQVVEDESYVP